MSKIGLVLLFGGRSPEHEVSLISAKNVLGSLDKKKYEIILIGIDRQGRWFLQNDISTPLNQGQAVALLPTGQSRKFLLLDSQEEKVKAFDVLFPLMHGPYGEDGSIQGLAKLANLPCVGAGILGSALGMDKDIVKRLLKNAGIPVAPHRCFSSSTLKSASWEDLSASWGSTLYVKPCNMGSSVGISRVEKPEDLYPALKKALSYDRKILVEQGISGREIECAILGNDNPKVSVCGEIRPYREFYNYQAKYIDQEGAALIIPPSLPSKTSRRIQELALACFQILECRGMARIDFFLKENDEIFVNEINTIPGFTNISMYPRLWEASGVSYAELLDSLIDLAIEENQALGKLRCDLEM